MAMWPS